MAGHFALDGTDHNSHAEQASMIRRSLLWRNSHATDPACARSSTGRNHQTGEGCMTRY